MNIVIVANGDMAPGAWAQAYLDKAELVMAADGGAQHLQAMGRMPDMLIGDFDSLSDQAVQAMKKADVEVLAHPSMKDESDLELALRHAAESQAEEILLFGALGGRLDQLLANVLLLNAPFLREKTVKIIEENQMAWVLRAGTEEIHGKEGDLVSLIPLGGDVQIGRTTGLAWSIKDEALVQGMSRGISNRLTADRATVEIDEGTLLCVLTDQSWQR